MKTTTLDLSKPEISYPLPGATKFDKDGPTRDEASELAHEHWDVCEIANCDVGQWAIASRSGWCAIVGKINGNLAILNKETDGSRTLYVY